MTTRFTRSRGANGRQRKWVKAKVTQKAPVPQLEHSQKSQPDR
jgi:hypothetical protein